MTRAKRTVKQVESEAERRDAFGVREAVFVDEQDVPEELEWDEYDDEAIHFVAYDGETAVGVARLRRVGDGDTVGDDDGEDGADAVGKLERVAVLESNRGEGWGKRLVVVAERVAREEGFAELRLHAQTHVESFYESLGYETTSDVFEEAGIPHVEMEKSL
ncbi:acetyltransferase [Haloprofundus marisrubri]|uniref:Acetyltransferase n=1 Tax=Haloprofundus marisrubri TaxID=1514971 RepID=A0A0W1R6T9_9EURY|nr:GNAT family N-acetyltransferase [Haloprofundus marisrubri]KTG09155.1 acetyltransferase [Haloprofundus marisrubri]